MTRRRLAALVALLAFVVLLVVEALLVIGNLGGLLLGLLGWALVVAGAWWALTEPMPRRGFGLAGIVIGLIVAALGVAVVVTGTAYILLWLASLVALFAVGIACARVAVAGAIPVDGDAAPPTHAVLLCNPWSGGGKVERFGLADLARAKGVDVVMLDHGLDLEQLARDAVADGADCLGMAGGDGSQALVASIAVEHDLPFVCVSAGTRNHFAHDLGLDRRDPRTSVAGFDEGVERRVDYATVGDRLFVNNVSLGVYAEVVQSDEYRDDKVGTVTTKLPDLVGSHAEPFDLQFTDPDGREVEGAFLIQVSNNPYALGGAVDRAQRHRLDTGTLGVFAVSSRTGPEAVELLTMTAVGRRSRSPHWHEFTAEEFEVRSRSGTIAAAIDGEALTLPTPLHFRIHPLGLRLRVPKRSIRRAERRRARDVDVRELLALVRGKGEHDG
jgi:diacylglycerol kinase family enzyme